MVIIQSRAILCVLYIAISCAPVRSLIGQEPESADSSVELRLWREHYFRLAEKQKFLVGEEGQTEAILRSKPLHFFANPAGGTQSHGSIFVWTNDDRPVVLGSLWSRRIGETRRVSGSFHSTALGSLQGIENGTVFWEPEQALEMELWPSDTPRTASPALRLVRMKNMMRALEVTRIHEDQQSRLRLLPQPLYRFRNGQVADGAVFGFFENWDPELFLLVETRVEQPGRWMIGVVRFSNKQLRLKLGDKLIWEYDPAGNEPSLGGPRLLYLSKSIETRPAVFTTQGVPEAKP